jgi:deazaflavin-dependent oxidoreductase (nitroreductase family)
MTAIAEPAATPAEPRAVAARIDRPDLPLAEPPPAARPGDPIAAAARFFRVLNRYLMVPVTRAGLGAWLSTPAGGAKVLLRIRGRKSGVVRETPLNYVVAEGAIWVLAGFGPRTEWYRNLLADPRVEAILPGRTVTGTVTDVRAPAVRRRIIPAILRSTAGPSLAAGVNPWRSTPDEVCAAMAWVPLLRIDPDGGPLAAGPDDPGGTAWIWRQAVVAAAFVAVLAGLTRGVRALRRSCVSRCWSMQQDVG